MREQVLQKIQITPEMFAAAERAYDDWRSAGDYEVPGFDPEFLRSIILAMGICIEETSPVKNTSNRALVAKRSMSFPRSHVMPRRIP